MENISVIHQPTHTNKFYRLECLRGAAALYVLLHHVSSNFLQLQHSIFGMPFRFGQEAVVLFFVLSGFVITYSISRGEDVGAKIYFLKRFRRIYPIFLVSLLLAALFPVREGKLYHPDLFIWLSGNLLMLQDIPSKPGIWIQPFFGNSPLWSLSYEWLFYLVFYPIWKFIPAQRQQWLVFSLSVVSILLTRVFPNHFANIFSLFPLWWTGVELARSYKKHGHIMTRDLIPQVLILLTNMILFLGFALFSWLNGDSPVINLYLLLQCRMYFDVLLFGSVFMLWKTIQYQGFDFFFSWFGLLSPISYAIYVIHFPIIFGMRLFDESHIYLDLICRIALIFALSWVLEKPFQTWINTRTKSWLKPNIFR